MRQVAQVERLATIGYQGRTLRQLVRRLREHDVRVLLDIRKVARSRRPDFNGTRMASALMRAGIEYQHLPALGSSQRLREHLYQTGDFERFRGLYLAYVRRWRRAEVRALARAARREGTICILCYESDAASCHRGIVAAEALRTHGKLEILHL